MDIIIINGDIWTMNRAEPRVSAVAVKSGRIVYAGNDSTALDFMTAETRVIDAGGQCVIPGFNDSHMHTLGYAASKSCVDLMGSRSREEVIERIKDFISKNKIPEGAAVTGMGWNQDIFVEKQFPNRCDLDKASDKHPIFVRRACGHIAVANSAALDISGIGSDTVSIDGGEIHRDENGRPNGILSENAMSLIKLPKEETSVEKIRDLIMLAAENLMECGITSVQTDDFDTSISNMVNEAYESLALEGRLTFRANQQRRGETLEDYKYLIAMKKPVDSINNYYKYGPLKIMADGSLGARTALMQEDYRDNPGNRGVAIYTHGEIQEIIDIAHNAGESVAVHAIGDGAIDMVLDCIEEAQKKNPRSDVRHGIVHAQITDKKILQRFKTLNVLAYIQPIFIQADSHIAAARAGTEKASSSYAFRTLMESGVHIPFGTDCPVESFDPFANIYCAVTRKGTDGFPPEGFNPGEALSVEEAVYAYTAEGAFASFEEDKKGMIKPGMLADIIILSQNIFKNSFENILKTKVTMTIFNGKVVYERSMPLV